MDVKQLSDSELLFKIIEAQEQETNVKHLVRLLQDEAKKRYKNGDLARVASPEVIKPKGIF